MSMLRISSAGLLLLAASASAQDWSGWRGAARDGKASLTAPASWPKELKQGWQVEVGEGHSTPALVDGKLYAFVRQANDEVTLCLDAASGKELWCVPYPAPFEINQLAKDHGKGPWSSPTVAGGKVYTFGMKGILSCLDAKDGKVVWRKDFKDRPANKPSDPLWYGNALSPLLTEGLCIVHAYGPTKGAITALDAATGEPRWSWDGDEPSSASPIVATVGGKAQVITQTASKAVGVALADGKLLWQVDYKTKYDQNSVTPVVFENLVILSGTGMGVTAYRIDGGKADQAWQTTDAAIYMSSPVLKGDRLFGFSEKKKGQYFCLDAKTGATLWPGPARQGDSGALVNAGDVLLGLNVGSELVAFDAGDKEYKELARYKVAETPTWAHPVVSGKSIFVKDRTKLTQWTLP